MGDVVLKVFFRNKRYMLDEMTLVKFFLQFAIFFGVKKPIYM